MAIGEEKVCLFMDQLSCHTSDKSKKAMRDMGFRYVYNLPYCPEFNPIDFVFAQVKTEVQGAASAEAGRTNIEWTSSHGDQGCPQREKERHYCLC